MIDTESEPGSWQDAIDNTPHLADQVRKNYQRGVDRPCAKLTEMQVREIRAARAGGEALHVIAKRYPCSTVTVFNIVHGHTWKHLLPGMGS